LEESDMTLMEVTIFEPWTKKDIIPAAGRGWKRAVGDYPWMKTDLPATI